MTIFQNLNQATTYYIHTYGRTTYRMSDHIVSFWTKFRQDNNKKCNLMFLIISKHLFSMMHHNILETQRNSPHAYINCNLTTISDVHFVDHQMAPSTNRATNINQVTDVNSNRQISLHVQRRVRVDVGHIFGVKTNPYLKIKYTFEIFHQPAVKLKRF